MPPFRVNWVSLREPRSVTWRWQGWALLLRKETVVVNGAFYATQTVFERSLVTFPCSCLVNNRIFLQGSGQASRRKHFVFSWVWIPSSFLSMAASLCLCLFRHSPCCQVGLIRRKLLGELSYSHCVPSARDPRSAEFLMLSGSQQKLSPASWYITPHHLYWEGRWHWVNDSLLRADKWATDTSESLGFASSFDCLVHVHMLLARGTAPWALAIVYCFLVVATVMPNVTKGCNQVTEMYNSVVLPSSRGAPCTI